MTKALHKRLILAVLGFYVVVAVLCLAVSDGAVVSLLENIRTINLSGEADLGLATIDIEIENLNREIERLQITVATLEGRSYANIQEIKQLQAKHRLNLLQMERLSSPSENAGGLLNYRTIMIGTIGSLVRFLKELEEEHIVLSDQVVLRPANDDGSTVALTLSLLVRSQ